MPVTQFVHVAIANALFLGSSTTFAHTGAYVGLFTSDPGFFGVQSGEVSGGGYTRIQPTWSVASFGDSRTVADISFPVATANWGTVTHVGIMDSATGGNMLAYEPTAAPISVGIDDQVNLKNGDFTVDVSFLNEGSGINTQRTGTDYRRSRFIDVIIDGGTLIAEPGSWVGLSWGDDAQPFQEIDPGLSEFSQAVPEYRRYKVDWSMTNTDPVTLTNTNAIAWMVESGIGTDIFIGWLDGLRTVQLTQDPIGVFAEVNNPNSLIWTEWHTEFGQASPTIRDVLRLPVGSMTIVF